MAWVGFIRCCGYWNQAEARGIAGPLLDNCRLFSRRQVGPPCFISSLPGLATRALAAAGHYHAAGHDFAAGHDYTAGHDYKYEAAIAHSWLEKRESGSLIHRLSPLSFAQPSATQINCLLPLPLV